MLQVGRLVAATHAILTGFFHGFFQFLQAYSLRVPQLFYDHFLPHPLKFITHKLFYYGQCTILKEVPLSS
jgi:hypothetical protein